ncbi:MAG: twin-arginine translocase TatA/TatE family subunit [Actinomycetota bacterium]|nr:twin-arginine translocase TatA/TatE family subunit [Actinomycetota bacterium]
MAILFLLLFGPSKLPQMARDVGRFVNEARRSMDEFKSELTAGVDDDDDENDKTPRRKQR